MAKCFRCGKTLSRPICKHCGYDVRSGVYLLTPWNKAYDLPKEEAMQTIPTQNVPVQETQTFVSRQETPIARFTRVDTTLDAGSYRQMVRQEAQDSSTGISNRTAGRRLVWRILLGVLCVVLLVVGCIFGGKKFVDYRERTEKEWWSEQGFSAEYDDTQKAYVIAGYQGEETSIQIPGSYRRKPVVIGNNAFENNQVLEKVTLSQGVTRIGADAFKDCTQLKEIEFSESVTEIGPGAFENCIRLTHVQIPKDVTVIAYNTFRNSGLVEVQFSGKETVIDWCAFEGCTELLSVAIPESVTEIGFSAFEGCTKIESVIIPAGVTKLGITAFAECENLRFAAVLGSVEELSVPFARCDNLQFLAISGSVQKINLVQQEALIALYYGGTEAQWAELEWESKETFQDTVIFKPDFQTEDWAAICRRDDVIWKDQYAQKADLYEMEIPDGTKYIGQKAFYQCRNLQSVTIPGSVIRIEKDAFLLCSSLQSLQIEDGVQEIGERAFSYCVKLETVTIPEGVIRIEDSAFECCFDLNSVTIPGSVTYMGQLMFYCSSLDEIHYTGTRAQWDALEWAEKESYEHLVVFVENE